jgi:methylmalonyl-CoA/ethylmalonyl-CoA epimerase
MVLMEKTLIKQVGQIGVPVKDLQRALEFYKEKLDLTLLFHTDTMAFFECSGLRLMLTLPEKEAFAHAGSVMYFQVDDIKAAYQDLSSKGVTFIDTPHIVARMGNTETWMVFFKDTEENVHALMSEEQL